MARGPPWHRPLLIVACPGSSAPLALSTGPRRRALLGATAPLGLLPRSPVLRAPTVLPQQPHRRCAAVRAPQASGAPVRTLCAWGPLLFAVHGWLNSGSNSLGSGCAPALAHVGACDSSWDHHSKTVRQHDCVLPIGVVCPAAYPSGLLWGGCCQCASGERLRPAVTPCSMPCRILLHRWCCHWLPPWHIPEQNRHG